eukprot:15115410-Heterocapsa_arctica.AAC.1
MAPTPETTRAGARRSPEAARMARRPSSTSRRRRGAHRGRRRAGRSRDHLLSPVPREQLAAVRAVGPEPRVLQP